MLAALPVRADPIRVGTSGDYTPFSVLEPGDGPDWPTGSAEGAARPEPQPGLSGFSVALVRAFAQASGHEIVWQRFRWPELAGDLAAGRFDLVASGVTVRVERSLAGRFSLPVTTSGAVVLVPAEGRLQTLEQLALPGIRLAVNAGGHLERVTRSAFPHAAVRAIDRNQDVPREIEAGRADAVVTDLLEAPHWLAAWPGLRALGPFTRDRKAVLFRADREALADQFDAWLLEAESSGLLSRLRVQHGLPTLRTARPLAALLASLDERLALMPAVAEAKRAQGAAIEAPERERVVIEEALAGVLAAAAQAGRPAPSEDAVRKLFRAQIEAAKDVQRRVLAGEPAAETPRVDLRDDLRPALLRIGRRIARLCVAVAEKPESVDLLRQETRSALGGHGLATERFDEIAEALAALGRPAEASAPQQEASEPAGDQR